jgi:site-specific DNA recombinase
MSGATRNRPQLVAMMARAAEFDIVLTESLDRLSRDQEDIAAIHKRLRFAGVAIVTLADGPIGGLLIGVKGAMAAQNI